MKKALSRNKYVDVLRTVPFFSGLENREITFFLNSSHIQDYSKSNHIFEYGDLADQFYVVLEGWVKLYRVNKEGEETVIALVTKGDTFCEVATFEGSNYPYSAQVVGGSARFVVIPAHIVREKVRDNPDIALKMLATMSHHMGQMNLLFEHITKLTTAQRVGCFLLKLSMDRQYTTTLQLPYNKYLVASRLGMQPETYSRAMKRLSKDLGIIFKSRDVTIPDIDKLQDYCEVFCFNDGQCDLEKRLLCMNSQCDIYRVLKLM